MACILKVPTKNEKGILVFTDRERDNVISKDEKLQQKILALKNNWVIGMHHNWITFDSPANTLFDFAMYLPTYTGTLPLIPFAATNFAPAFFHPNTGEKFWDVLCVARAVRFKNIPEFFNAVRKLYDRGKKYRILFICPVPPYERSKKKYHFYEIRKVYDALFSEEEKNYFTLLTTDYRDPFPFDLETLAHFYRSSRVFLHTSHKEKQGRAVGYAWATQMPVIGLPGIGTPLPDALKVAPYFYEAKNYDDFPDLIERAVETDKTHEHTDLGWRNVAELFSEKTTSKTLDAELQKLFSSKQLPYTVDRLFTSNIGIRIARGHTADSDLVDIVPMSLTHLVDILMSDSQSIEHITPSEKDPEMMLARKFPSSKKVSWWKKIFSK